MKRLACLILTASILIIALFGGLVPSGSVHAQTSVTGTLTCNTEWTVAQSPISLNGSLTVGTNVTLTIDPEVTVNMGNYGLTVYGNLIAQGNAGDPITINGNTNQEYSSNAIMFMQNYSANVASSPSIIQNAVLNSVAVNIDSGASTEVDNCTFNYGALYEGPITVTDSPASISNNIINYNAQNSQYNVNLVSVYSCSPTISNNQFEGSFSANNVAISVSGGSPIISGNAFAAAYCNNSFGVEVASGSPQIDNNQFQGNGWLIGVDGQYSASFTVSDNVFTNCYFGVNAEDGTLTVQGNQFLKGTDGIDIDPAATVTVTDNLIDSNSRYGINGGGTITSNTISNNQIGIHNPPSGIISQNNVVGNTQNSITSTIEDVNAQNNWWGTTDTAAINQTIYDKKIDPHLGTVLFVPFLNAPSTSAPAIPSYTPATTPPPTQQQSTPAPTPTEQPIVTPVVPTATPVQFSQTFDYQVGSLLNLNMITTATALVLVLVWVVVILGYVVKGAIPKRKPKE